MTMENAAIVIDVRQFAPVYKHQIIFAAWEAMANGTTMYLLNDHDPKPLYYQLAAEYSGTFEWNYIESGPLLWRIEVVKSSTDQSGHVAR